MLYASKRRSYRPPHPPGPQPVAVVRQIIARRARLFSLDVDGIGMGEGQTIRPAWRERARCGPRGRSTGRELLVWLGGAKEN